MKRLPLCLALLVTPALAQEADYTPPDRELWTQMTMAFGNISMPLAAHQQVLTIMQNVQNEARLREARKAAAAKATPETPPAAPK